ncbi:MAG: ABC transporter substrate-binding protein [Micrococcales bacterium]|nr:ABC transporter substrate-binding protein [Micrococcales bacterium]
MTAPLRLACIDSEAPPLFQLNDPERGRLGYEPAVGQLIADELGRNLEWVYLPWNDMIPAVQRGEADGVLCGQGIIPSREAQVDFTRPYAVFHESVLMRRGEAVPDAGGLRGKRVAAIADSANMALAQSFEGADVVPFGGDSDDVYAEMLAALKSGEVDAVVDDDVVFVPLGSSDPDFELCFTVRTGNRWAVGCAKDRPDVRQEIDSALASILGDGRLEAVWREWLPTLEYPFGERP